MSESVRMLPQRLRDTLARLESDVDLWVASTDPHTATPHLVPLSFLWTRNVLLIAVHANSPTGRNLRANARARLALGLTRDVVLIDATVAEMLPSGDIPPDEGDAYAARTGWDPRTPANYMFVRLRPQLVQAWREVDELAGRDLMRDGQWLGDGLSAG